MATGNIISKVRVGSAIHKIASGFYGTCATAAATAAKVATLPQASTDDTQSFTDDVLAVGITVHVKFTYANTASSPTLKIGSSTAKSILPTTVVWSAGDVLSFTYDGTYWVANDFQLDTKVTQTETTTTGTYEVLFAGSSGSSTTTEGTRKSANITVAPNNGVLYVSNSVIVSDDSSFSSSGVEFGQGSAYVQYDSSDRDLTLYSDGDVSVNKEYIVINGIRLYLSTSEPTGTIPPGSLGIGW